MDAPKLGIVEPDNFSSTAKELLARHFTVEEFQGDSLSAFVADKTALFVRLHYPIDDALIEHAPLLRYVCSPTTGLNHISIHSGAVEVLSLKGETEFLTTIRATPEHVIGLTIALLRNYRLAFRDEYNHVWDRDPYRGFELYGSHVGIIGLGRVGKLVAEYLKAFGADIGYCDPAVPVSEVEQLVSHRFENTLETVHESNIVILCADYREANKHMFNEQHFAALKDKFFVNAARGELVDEQALLACVEKGQFGGIALDVFEDETGDMPLYKPILRAASGKNVIVTPHIGGATYTSMARTEEFIARKLLKTISFDVQ